MQPSEHTVLGCQSPLEDLHCGAVPWGWEGSLSVSVLCSPSNSGHQWYLLTSNVLLDVHDQPSAVVSVVHGLHVYHSGLNSRFIL